VRSRAGVQCQVPVWHRMPPPRARAALIYRGQVVNEEKFSVSLESMEPSATFPSTRGADPPFPVSPSLPCLAGLGLGLGIALGLDLEHTRGHAGRGS